MTMATPKYGRRHQQGINWITTVAMVGFHAGALAALLFIDYGAMLTALVLYIVAGMFGIGMCYHRLLTHRAYKTPKLLEYALTWCATLALEGGSIFWVATHRIHHQHSDREGDPHTPREGTWWAHMGWIMMGAGMHHDASLLARYAPDLARDPVHVALSKWHWTSNVIVGLGASGVRWPALCAVGHFLSHDGGPAQHVARQLCYPQVGLAPIHDDR